MIPVAVDRRSLRWELAKRTRGHRGRARTMGAAPSQAQVNAAASVAVAASQGFTNPAADINALASILGIGGNSKALYQQFDPKALQAVSVYGPNFVAGSAALGLNPVPVASAMSDYLAENNIQLTPSQLLAGFSTPANPSMNSGLSGLSSMLPYVIGGGGLLLLLFVLRN